jgi:phosphoenolpyruvate---glycerone phosphotransferase subunit DhaL
VSRLLLCLGAVAQDVMAAAPKLNELDAQAGDGDLGVTMATAARIVLDLLPDLNGASTSDVLNACGGAIARGAPSTSGTLVATGLLRAGRVVSDAGSNAVVVVAQSLDAARAGIQERGQAEVGSKTLLDALVPAIEAVRLASDNGSDMKQALAAAAAAADEGARTTTTMQPRHGRAGWLANRSAGHEDAGARLVAIMLASAAKSVVGSGSAGTP